MRLATSVAVERALMVPVDTTKDALFVPAETVTEAGIVMFAEPVPSPRVTLTELVGVEARVTVQEELLALSNAVGVQVKLEILGGSLIVSVAPVAVAAIVFAAAETANTCVRPSVDVAGACGDTWKIAVAKTPLGMAAALIPQAIHRVCPVPLEQVNVFPTEVKAAPGLSVMPLMELAE